MDLDTLSEPHHRTVRVVVIGRVQGVGYRAWTERHARRRGLSGTVCNRLDGSVEAVLSGPSEAVNAMLAAMRTGPPGARVDDLCEQDAGDQDLPAGDFQVRPTR